MTSFSVALITWVACTGAPERWDEQGDACLSCHIGIEPIHATQPGPTECVVCHGGDPTSLTKEAAHVSPPTTWADIRGDGLPAAPEGYIKDFSPNQLDQLPSEYVRFINPGDIRVAATTCGPCHEGVTERVKRSIMTTNAGHYMPTLFLGGYQGPDAVYGSTHITDPECDPDAFPGSVCELVPLEPPPQSAYDSAFADKDWEAIEQIAYEHYLAKSCDTCHAAGYGDNNAPFKYRSTGCTSCHMVNDKFGFYLGGDPTLPAATPGYSAEHRITSQIPTEQCATCHFQGGRIGLLFRGIREAGFSETPPNALAWEPGAYGKTNPNFYLSDEDTTNGYDETPPDVHWELGMHCADCHVGTDVHGDGALYSTSKQQLDLRCEDCHGTVRQVAEADAAGVFRTSRGRALPQLRQDGADVVLDGIDGTPHVVGQVAELLEQRGPSSNMWEAMAPDDEGWSHTDDLTCDACHTSYNLYCVGCHVSMDLRFDQVDHQTGKAMPGLVKGSREDWSLDHVMLAMAPDGRAQSVAPSQQVQMTVKHADGTRVVGGDHPDLDGDVGTFRQSPVSEAPNNGFHTFFQHTVSRRPRSCAVCHPTTNSQEETTRVRGVYGFGTGEFMLELPGGGSVDALKFLHEDGTPLTEWVHTGSGPLPEARRDRAMGVILDELSP